MKNILLIPGDGIGPEVMAAAKELLTCMVARCSLPLSLHEVDWGADRWLKSREGIPDGVLDEIPHKYDAILFGALGDPRIPDMAHGREILLALRFGLDLYVNLRPIKLVASGLNVLKNARKEEIDMVIFRENTEDIYLGLGGSRDTGTKKEITIDGSKHSYRGVRRIITQAFEYALAQNRKRVTLVDKSNAIKFGGRLWQRVFAEVSACYPQVLADHLFVDVAAMQMILQPQRFDVMVTSNLFGDILSDIGAALMGGLGLAASANINPGVIGMFEPVHGSAPDIAGQNIANPFAMFLAVSMMFNNLGYLVQSKSIEDAISDSIERGLTTRDLGGGLSCSEAANAIIRRCCS